MPRNLIYCGLHPAPPQPEPAPAQPSIIGNVTPYKNRKADSPPPKKQQIRPDSSLPSISEGSAYDKFSKDVTHDFSSVNMPFEKLQNDPTKMFF